MALRPGRRGHRDNFERVLESRYTSFSRIQCKRVLRSGRVLPGKVSDLYAKEQQTDIAMLTGIMNGMWSPVLSGFRHLVLWCDFENLVDA